MGYYNLCYQSIIGPLFFHINYFLSLFGDSFQASVQQLCPCFQRSFCFQYYSCFSHLAGDFAYSFSGKTKSLNLIFTVSFLQTTPTPVNILSLSILKHVHIFTYHSSQARSSPRSQTIFLSPLANILSLYSSLFNSKSIL